MSKIFQYSSITFNLSLKYNKFLSYSIEVSVIITPYLMLSYDEVIFLNTVKRILAALYIIPILIML